ncbi:MAG: DUF2007 domain-containing protein [Bacteroidia bacterium]|nr:DUF2007 domain-containing protein [Bacteroidia bacterium]
MENWVKVYKSGSAIDAEIVKDMLLEQNIEAVVVNKIDSSLNFGEASVLCMAEKEEAAKEFIKSNFSNEHE